LAILDAERLRLETIPEDSQGRACVSTLIFDVQMLQQALPIVRAAFLNAVWSVAHHENQRATSICNQRQMALAKQLDLALRHHRYCSPHLSFHSSFPFVDFGLLLV
jgi:hypothetical protein